MFEVRIHGRGGQGVVTAAELLSVAAFASGRQAQAFPSFGSERTGAPVVAFCRISGRPIRLREPVATPDALIIGDPTLLGQVDLFAGLADDAFVVVNSTHDLTGLGLHRYADRLSPRRTVVVAASQLALRHVGRPVPNAALLGAFAALTGQITLAAVGAAISGRFAGAVAVGNLTAATEAYDLVHADLRDVHADPRGAGPDPYPKETADA